MRRHHGRESGFTLMEMAIVVAILSLLAAVATPMVLQRMMDARIEATREEAKALHEAIVGRADQPGNFGFVGDIGRFPDTFEQLVSAAGLPLYSTATTRGVGVGWKGPYINQGASPADYLQDAFGRPYPGVSTGQVRSAGPDGIAGNADDIVYPPSPPAIRGSVYVSVKTLDGQKVLTDPPGYAVDVYYAGDGVERVIRDTSAPFRFDNIPMGMRAIVVVKTTGQGPGVPVAQDTIVVRPRNVTAVELWF